MCTYRGAGSKLGILLSTFLVCGAAAQTSSGNRFEDVFSPPNHAPPSFTRPDVSSTFRPATSQPSPESKRHTPAGVLRELLLPSPAEADTPRVVDTELGAKAKSIEAPAPPSTTSSVPSSTAEARQSRTKRKVIAQRPASANAKNRGLGTVRAAWYQHPGRTASGEKYNPDGRTAAHKSLPFGTRLRVVNERNGRSVTVRINDRVPRTAKYPLDLSRGSARAIGVDGVASVALYKAP